MSSLTDAVQGMTCTHWVNAILAEAGYTLVSA